MLFEIGLHAILDGYNREAVSSFHAAYERFHEFYVRVVCCSNGTDLNVFNEAWRSLALSERQLGAFVITYVIHESIAPELLDKSKKINGKDPIKFRNDVIHKGIIPTREEAICVGQAVFDTIHPIIGMLRTKYWQHFID
jgi:hypothetical protein